MIVNNLSQSDLIIDEVYGGSRKGSASDDPLPSLMGVASGAGFRYLGKRPKTDTLTMLLLKTNFKDVDWPDSLNRETGVFTYYGDKREPGDLHNTPRQGNEILRNIFDSAHDYTYTDHFPPIFVFGGTDVYRDVQFLGLAVPGVEGMSADEDLVAVWRTSSDGRRFQNYKASFTILNINKISRKWIIDIIQTRDPTSSPSAPEAWLDWVKARKLHPLKSSPTTRLRNKEQQMPQDKQDESLIKAIIQRYNDGPTDFERCAMEIASLSLPNIIDWVLTRPWRDGGRDAIGTYRIGSEVDHIDVQFALEAKCYSLNHGVGVKELSRLISRLRHRQFGILVTTSYLSHQAYKELSHDSHPVVIISAYDIIYIVKRKIGSKEALCKWMERI
jgi:hypothetical protein